jgi:hypothetical protein
MSIVTDDMVKVALNACRVGADALAPGWMRRALAAVAPAIAAQERDACAKILADKAAELRAQDAEWGGPPTANSAVISPVLDRLTAAIRARGENT